MMPISASIKGAYPDLLHSTCLEISPPNSTISRFPSTTQTRCIFAMLSTSIASAAHVLAGLLLLARPANGDLDKPLISPSFPPLGLNLMNALTPTQSTRDSWEWGCKLPS